VNGVGISLSNSVEQLGHRPMTAHAARGHCYVQHVTLATYEWLERDNYSTR
jgi:hypothetical protein